jgi:hypothetical protein
MKKPEFIIGVILCITIGFFIFYEYLNYRKVVQNAVPSIEFLEEHVVLMLDTRILSVNGEFTVKNMSENRSSFKIFFSFPSDSNQGTPQNIKIIHDSTAIHHKWHNNSMISFMLNLEPETRETFRIEYSQNLGSTSAAYCMASMRDWGKPLERASFEVRVPLDLPELSINYRPDSVLSTPVYKSYLIRRKDFSSHEDLIVKWSDNS